MWNANHGGPTRRPLSGTATHTGDAVWLDIGGTATKQLGTGIVVAGSFGGLCLYSAITGGVWGGTGATIVVYIMSSVLIGLALICALGWRTASRPRRLGFNAWGITWHDSRGKSWSVRWEELAEVTVSRTGRERAYSLVTPRNILVRLDLVPADAHFRSRHPEMEHLWEFHHMRNGYRLALGQTPNFIHDIDDAMRRFRPGIYRGIRHDGTIAGLR